MVGPITESFEREKVIDTLFQENVKEEYAFWDYFSIQDSEVIIHYHYWTHTDGKSIPKYNQSSMKITYGGIKL